MRRFAPVYCCLGGAGFASHIHVAHGRLYIRSLVRSEAFFRVKGPAAHDSRSVVFGKTMDFRHEYMQSVEERDK